MICEHQSDVEENEDDDAEDAQWNKGENEGIDSTDNLKKVKRKESLNIQHFCR